MNSINLIYLHVAFTLMNLDLEFIVIIIIVIIYVIIY